LSRQVEVVEFGIMSCEHSGLDNVLELCAPLYFLKSVFLQALCVVYRFVLVNLVYCIVCGVSRKLLAIIASIQ